MLCGVETYSCQALYRVADHLSTRPPLVPVEKSLPVLFFAQGGGFLSVKANLVEKLSHIRGIQHGQIQMARIVLIEAGDGDLGRMIENRPLGAVFEFLQRKGPEVGCRATS